MQRRSKPIDDMPSINSEVAFAIAPEPITAFYDSACKKKWYVGEPPSGSNSKETTPISSPAPSPKIRAKSVVKTSDEDESCFNLFLLSSEVPLSNKTTPYASEEELELLKSNIIQEAALNNSIRQLAVPKAKPMDIPQSTNHGNGKRRGLHYKSYLN